MKSKINTFIFDCFNVICHPPISSWYNANMTERGFSDENFSVILKDFDLGNVSEEDLYKYFSKYEGIKFGAREIKEQVDKYLRFDNELIEIIKKLKNKGYKIALLSNGNSSFFERKIYTEYPEFKKLFDEIVISSDVKMLKPDSEIYLYTLEKINSKPEESIFIDDVKINVDGAVNVGINGYQYINCDQFTDFVKSLGIELN